MLPFIVWEPRVSFCHQVLSHMQSFMQMEETMLPTCSGATSSQRLRVQKGRCRRACRCPVQKESIIPDRHANCTTHLSAFPALLSAQNCKSLLKKCQYHGYCLPFGSLGRLWPHTCAVQGPDAWPSLQDVQTHKESSREAPCCGTPPPEDAQNKCNSSPAARQDEITALTKTGQGLCPAGCNPQGSLVACTPGLTRAAVS